MKLALSALVAVAAMAKTASAASIVTCAEQINCIKFTKTALEGTCGDGSCMWEVCLEIDLDSPQCLKDATDTVSHVCDNAGNDGCARNPNPAWVIDTPAPGPYTNDADGDAVCVSPNSDVKCKGANGFTMCKQGVAGDRLMFIVKDGNDAAEDPAVSFSLSSPEPAALAFASPLNQGCDMAVCEQGNADVNCMGSYAKERVWSYVIGGADPTLPHCPDPNCGAPTAEPNPSPTYMPVPSPTFEPNPAPTKMPNPAPTAEPNPAPTQAPNPGPTAAPNPAPTKMPNPAPTAEPNPSPTKMPVTLSPTECPPSGHPDRPTPAPAPTPTKDPGCVEPNPINFAEHDFTIDPVTGPGGELVGVLRHFWANNFTTENLDSGYPDGEMILQWFAPDPSVVNIVLTKLDFEHCEDEVDNFGGLTFLPPLYNSALRVYALPIDVEQTLIEGSDIWSGATTDGYGEIKFCMRIQAFIPLECEDDIEITRLKTKITLRIETVEGFKLPVDLQCWIDEVEVSDSVETDYLDDPYICNGTMDEVDAPEDGYLPGENFCFCLEVDEAAQDDTFVYDVNSVMVDSGVVSFSKSKDENGVVSGNPLITWYCNPDLEICRVCVLLVEDLWPFEVCDPEDCGPDCDPKTSCPDAGVDVSGEVTVGFGESHPDATGGRKLQDAGSSSFDIKAKFVQNTGKPDRKTVMKCATKAVKKCKKKKGCEALTCAKKFVNNKCKFTTFKSAAKKEKKKAQAFVQKRLKC